ncbi:uncharacterized protein B0T15DRAFT_542801 [Chaetomium strumarium]|uniref:Uncharacterized protein n=1 Tax=Chaetomium strumarium TaxID=1170767 RepID=A0AAJ0LYL5_9PEZI|nr:hypothetical protein B0T15DRAFT_542801 [Chaetomium strumarium]
MDDSARLVAQLHDKLAELDGKVAAYQRDMLAQFHKHMDECLKSYPEHISNEVSQAIAESMSTGKYPALHPLSCDMLESPSIDHNAWDGRKKSPPPILRHTSGTPKEAARSIHAREKEFHGLFTPNYLPLLESNHRTYHSPPTSPPPASGGSSLPLSTDNVKKVEESTRSLSTDDQGRPDPVRRSTDRSTSSVESSNSDSKARRSALRRPSTTSSNKGSPRRVRFEFEGHEVFPASSSPQASTAIPAQASGAGTQPEAVARPVATEDESTAYAGTSLLDVEGEEDLFPKPRKVSSTQALQALTRSPLEEGTTWTVVNPDPEEPIKMNGKKQQDSATDALATKVDSQASSEADDLDDGSRREFLGSPIEEREAIYDDDEDGNASDEEFLSMAPKKKTPSPTAKLPFAKPVSSPAASRTATLTANGKPHLDDDQDSLFDFEDEGGRTNPQAQRQPPKYLPEPEDEEDETPGRRPRTAAREESDEASGLPPVSPSAALFEHSVGSYMGRSMTIAPIKDPKLYDEIASMRDVPFFVGSIHDPGAREDLGSYRPGGLARPSIDTPRSFTERLLLEDEMERRKAVRGRVDDRS